MISNKKASGFRGFFVQYKKQTLGGNSRLVIRSLSAKKTRISAIASQQFIVSTMFDNAAIIHNIDTIGQLHRRKPITDNQSTTMPNTSVNHQKPVKAIRIGNRKVVSRPLRPIARPATAPESRSTSNILAAPMPWAAVPTARPVATGEVTPISRQNSGPHTAPRQPVNTTSAAVNGAIPPIFSTILIAIGVVTDFGANERIISRLPPQNPGQATSGEDGCQ